MPQNESQTKNVVIIRNPFWYDFGGGERVPVDISAEMVQYGYNPIIVSSSPKLLEYARSKQLQTVKGWWWSRQDWSGARVLLFPIYVIWQLILIGWYLRLFLKFRPIAVHPQGKDDFIAATIAAKLLGIQVFWSDYADLKYIYLNLRVWYKNPIGKLVKLCSFLADKILLTSESDKRLIEAAQGGLLDKRYVIFYNGAFDKPELVNTTPNNPGVIFAATSRLVTAKGIGELIEAFISIKPRHPGAKLWLFGEGPERERFEEMARGHDDIIFHGFPPDALQQVSTADIFVHPSYLEGFSISLVEAAMMGKPIIACDVGGNPELVNDEIGILVPVQNAAALAEAMDTLASNKPLRQQMGARARKTYEENLNFANLVRDQFITLYDKN